MIIDELEEYWRTARSQYLQDFIQATTVATNTIDQNVSFARIQLVDEFLANITLIRDEYGKE